jgi:threonine/homoserine/homoserine lactone efflux protein
MGICTNGVYAFAAGAASGLLKRNAPFMRSQRYVTGGIYIALGVTTALAGSDRGK